MHNPADNKLPFGSVWGEVINGAPGYPVIIQIYQNGKPVHFAQVDVKNDGSYDYYFRIRDVEGDKVINIFQGDYTVYVFKTVYLTPTLTVTQEIFKISSTRIVIRRARRASIPRPVT